MDKRISFAKKYLPASLYDEISKFDTVNEIRLRKDRISTITSNGKNIILNYRADKTSIYDIFMSLCKGSPYAQTENIINGFIILEEGVRIGVSGSAVMRKGKAENVSEIDSLNIRVPHSVYNAADELYKYFKETGQKKKYIALFSARSRKNNGLERFYKTGRVGRDALRIAVIDERCELYDNEMHSSALVDLYSVYPKDLAIENAVRTMSPQLIVCDEIGTEEEADTIISVQNCGVPIVASTHGSSFTEIKKRPGIKKLFDHNVFTSAVLLKREGNRCLFEIDEVNDV